MAYTKRTRTRGASCAEFRTFPMIGAPIESVETPVLILDFDAFERNLQRMAKIAFDGKIGLRPHAKAHKSPDIAMMQMALGAVGICCQTVKEAETMVNTGVIDVLLTNQLVDERKLRRLVALTSRARIAICVDCEEQVVAAGNVIRDCGGELTVLVEIDVGHGRCGMQPGDAVLPVVDLIYRTPGLRFAGLQAYHGAAQHMRRYAERKDAINRAVGYVIETKDVLEKRGIACELVTGGGTGTYRLELVSEVYTEIQPGSYIFMDADYAKNLGEDHRPPHEFEQSLFVRASVISRAVPGYAILDAGLKALSIDSGYPIVFERPTLLPVGMADEHTKLKVPIDEDRLRIGDKLNLVPGHVDPTVNLHDCFVGIREGRVERLLRIVARGWGT